MSDMIVFYLCDGKDEKCKKEYCYKNGGPCYHTKDIDHATNFEKSINNAAYFETKDVDFTERVIEVMNTEINDKEKDFLITCINAAAASGIKHDEISNLDIVDLMRKLGADKDNINKLIFNLYKFA